MDTAKRTALAAAFDAFNAHSEHLHGAYEQLQQRVVQLANALDRARDAREGQLREKQQLAERLTQTLEALPALVVVVDAQGLITDANRLAIDTFADELLGKTWSDVSEQVFVRAEGDSGELATRDGRWYALSRRALRQRGHILVFTDVTSARHTREQAQRQERLAMLGEMAARLAHQIRTPLSAAMLYASQSAKPGAQASASTCSKIVSRLHDLEAMVNDMLRFARGIPANDEFLTSHDLIEDVAAATRDILPDGLTLRVRLGRTPVSFRANRHALYGALNNLVANAIQHSGEDGIVTLSDGIDEMDRVCLRVSDTGCGVSATLRHQIFEPFFTTRAEGTGLGLAVVRSVAQAHNGDVEFESDTRGTTFSMCLPAHIELEECSSADDVSQFAISGDASSATYALAGYAHG
ncbi:MAG: ATP-binding protein [Pseudomonadota bacterium]